MRPALWLLPVPLAAIAVAVLARRPAEPSAQASAAAPPSEHAPATTSPAWVATKIPPRPPRTLSAAPSRETTGPKPMTESRTALMSSHVPIVATLSIDQPASPRERLLAARGGGEPRQAQLDRLSDRTKAYLEKLRDERAGATGDERARLTRTIKAIQKNQSLRDRVMKSSVHVPARPGTSVAGLDVPVTDKAQR